MEKNPMNYEGNLPPLTTRQILLNVNNLENGTYELVLLQNGIAIKRIIFKKQ